ncbi:MAG: HAMP domain-containing protein [Pyrinomonadaceae bacterium]|nr:HAMP domain-containing protein [Blastocatellia bacterium]MCW5957636.1 HAMP domain-containing protein [Pyrinomonadaceae bacterium]
MKLFLKIFLWFLAAVAVSNAVIYFVTRTFQTEPLINRFQRSTRNQMNIYGGTATQIARAEGTEGLDTYLGRLQGQDSTRKVVLVSGDGKVWFGPENEIADVSEIVRQTIETGEVQTDFSTEERSLGASPVDLPDGKRLALVFQWERGTPPSLFWGSTIAYMRLGGLLLTGVILCWLLALYLTSPIRKLREATNKFAGGDLTTRVAEKVGRRRDEISDLARDFDSMAERIESLVMSQQRLNRDISHELRSPLARMNVALEMARQKATPETMPQLTRIENESFRLNEMISRLLTLSKLETGSQDFDRHELNLKGLVEQIASDADFEAKARNRSVKVVRADDCRVIGSENLIHSAIENILRNAVRYTKEGTAVEVSLSNGNGRAEITIADHGEGVPEVELKNLFKPFYRVEEARDRGSGGTGLGLAIAEQAVKLHKGTISAKNTADGLEVEIVLAAMPKNGNGLV